MNEGLFARLDALYGKRDSLGLTAEQKRVLERHHTKYRREGAALAPDKKKRLAVIVERLAAILGVMALQHALLLGSEAEAVALAVERVEPREQAVVHPHLVPVGGGAGRDVALDRQQGVFQSVPQSWPKTSWTRSRARPEFSAR